MLSLLRHRNFLWLLLLPVLGLFRIPAQGQTNEVAGELHSAAAVRALSVAAANQNLPVRFTGVVTYSEPAANLTFVHNGGVGIYVPTDRILHQLRAGDLVEVTGVTVPGGFAPCVMGKGTNRPAEVRLLGEAPLPEARVLTVAELNRPANDCQWFEVRGKVIEVFAEKPPLAMLPHAVLRLNVDGENLLVVIPDIGGPGELPDHLIGTQVRVTGTMGTTSNRRRQLTREFLYVQTLAQVVVLDSGEMQAGSLPLVSANSLLQFTGGNDSPRVRVRGSVLWYDSQRGLYLRDAGSGLFVQSTQPGHVSRGDVVEAVGYATPAPPKPYLRDAVFRVVAPGEPPKPRRLEPGMPNLEEMQADLITIEVEMLVRKDEGDECVLGLRWGQELMEARLNTRRTFGLPEFAPGSRLRLTGIGSFNVSSDRRLSQGTLTLKLRDPADIIIVATPPWLTLQRAGLILTLLVAACGLAGLWIFLLRRRVEQQTSVIRGHMMREAVHQERARIARDFHDTVQQQLAGINLELQTAELGLDHAHVEARNSVQVSRQMIRHTLAETRQTIWDLRSPALEQGGLISAIEDYTASLQKSNSAQLELQVTGTPRRFPGALEQGLFRITQEAVTNALKHGQARHCTVGVDFTERGVHLRVQDDGCGFRHGEFPSGGELHFGLLGMQERANKIRAALDIRSQPGQGTLVVVTAEIPL